MPNQTYAEDLELRNLRDVRFRQALSLAIDRDEINELYLAWLYCQYTLHPSSEFYQEEPGRRFAEYGP